MDIYSIYKATNIVNGKVYIGFAKNVNNRKHRHKHFALTKGVSNYFYTVIRKYGWNNFQWEIIYQSKDRLHTLNVMENFFIVEYKTYIGYKDCRGYNMTLGGDGSLGNNNPKTQSHKDAISKSLSGKKKSVEHIGLAAFNRSKEYMMLNPQNEVVHIKNMAEFCRNNNLNQSHMIGVCNGRSGYLSHKGYRKLINV